MYHPLHFWTANGGKVIGMSGARPFHLSLLFLIVLFWASSCLGQDQQRSSSVTQFPSTTAGDPEPPQITGTVIDRSGAVIAGAQVTLTVEGQPKERMAVSNGAGQFLFSNVPGGHFQLTITSTGFAPQTFSGTLGPGQTDNLLPIMLDVGPAVTTVNVGVPQTEVAEEQMKIEEKQRVLAIVPNFYVSYIPNAAPLDTKQKFQLALRTVVDPYTLIIVGGIAGVQQAQGHFAGYGQGLEGYAKRYGAGYADTLTGTFLGNAVFPALLKQDPRYFYKGTGNMGSRTLYAISRAFICRGDNGREQPNYSFVLGALASGGISNLYYPPNDRNGAGLTFANAAFDVAGGAATNILQEFVIPKFTPRLHKKNQINSQTQNGSEAANP